jgi:ribulose-bisphosphate carboxylase large chain
MHATFTRNPKHGLTMLALAKSARLVGVDNIHIGTVIGKLVSPRNEVIALEQDLGSPEVEESFSQGILQQSWHSIKPTIPCSSGGLHTGIVPDVMKLLGNDCLLQLGGGIHGHPQGTRYGAESLRQAIDATLANKTLREAAKDPENKALSHALEHFGHEHPV